MAVLVEACVDSLASAQRARSGGASRLELCENLAEGGTTPNLRLVAEVRAGIPLPLHVLIRPRTGGFHYDGDEVAVMLRDIAAVRKLAADGVVLGVLDADRAIDLTVTRRLLDAARPLAVTFHRAFDAVADPFTALNTLAALGIERVLTAGRAASAEAGLATLAALVAQADGRLIVMAGGGIRARNARRIVEQSGVREIHLGAGDAAEPERVREVVAAVNR
jgi:copper homeostasis protein